MYPYPVRVTGLTGDATTGQIKMVEQIQKLLGTEMPAEKTKQCYSDYINKYITAYKKAVKEGAG